MILMLSVLSAGAVEPPVATVTGGAIRGARTQAGAVFRGIPYARPPVGDWRWREPQPLEPWKGVRDASAPAAICPQNPLGSGAYVQPLAKRYGADYRVPLAQLSEDCLYLNVWAPEWPPKQARAVMFWIHGGSNRLGGGSEAGYDGESLAAHGVVVVTINYRLGPLGFFAHPELTRESPHHSSGNYGLLDQIAALSWVRENIARFGGDPARVTVFGESAGAIDTGVLMASPLAAGLFQRAIIESGPVLGLVYPQPLASGEQYGERIAQAALGTASLDSALRRLRALPASEILRAGAEAARQAPDPGFLVDGWVLPRTPAEMFAAGKQHAVALLIGNNGREASSFRGSAGGGASAVGSLNKTLRIFYGGFTPLVATAYVVDTKLGRLAAADEWVNDVLMTCPAAAMALLNVAGGRPAYVYQFRRSIPGKGEADLGSFHGLELPYVFRAFDRPIWNWLAFSQQDRLLGDTIEAYWTNFAKTGNPNGAGLPHWPAFRGAEEGYMEFSKDARAVPQRGLRPRFCTLDPETVRRRLVENR